MRVLMLLLAIRLTHCLRILAVLPFPMKSHQIVFNSLLAALVERNHQVTVYSGFPIKSNATNYRHIQIGSSLTLEKIYSFESLKTTINKEKLLKPLNFQKVNNNLSEETLNLPEIKVLLQSKETYDVILLETFFGQEALIGFGYKFNAPVVTLSSFGSNSVLDSLMGNPNPLAYIASYELGFTNILTFCQRLRNLIKTLSELQYNYFYHIPNQEAILVKHFTNHTKSQLPSLTSLLRNVAVVLLNTQPEVNYPRPWLQKMILVGGLHIPQNRTALPKDIQHFIDGAEEGFIYFSLGSTFSAASMPGHIKEAFINAFSNVSLRVIWKSDMSQTGLPGNIIVVKWAPQTDILANKKCRAFITHGGLLSFLEATHFGVPLIGIPVFADQPTNIAKVEQAEIGVKLDMLNISASSVTWALNEVLYKTKYQRNMGQLSSQMRDRLTESPLDTAVHWVVYVAKHRGAPQLKSPSQFMSLFQYFFVDIILSVLLVFSLMLIALCKICKNKHFYTDLLYKKNKLKNQ